MICWNILFQAAGNNIILKKTEIKQWRKFGKWYKWKFENEFNMNIKKKRGKHDVFYFKSNIPHTFMCSVGILWQVNQEFHTLNNNNLLPIIPFGEGSRKLYLLSIKEMHIFGFQLISNNFSS